MPKAPRKVFQRPFLATNRVTGERELMMAPNHSSAKRWAAGTFMRGRGKDAFARAMDETDVGEYYGPYLPNDEYFMHHDFGYGRSHVFPQATYIREATMKPDPRFEDNPWLDDEHMKGKDFIPEVDEFVDWQNYAGGYSGYSPRVKAEVLRRLRGLPPIRYRKADFGPIGTNEYGDFQFKLPDERYIDFDREKYAVPDPISGEGVWTLDDWMNDRGMRW